MKNVFGIAALVAVFAGIWYGPVGAAFAFLGVVAFGGCAVGLLSLCRVI